ncbi:MAG: M48 family metalloprotease [Armatimonadetes bacterium]|nr:M48 family metalloprotease [Armatimonadota bacterium]
MRNLNTKYIFALIVSFCMAAACPSISNAITFEKEIEIGAKYDVEILKQTPLYTDEAAQKEIDRVGQLIVKNGGLNRPQMVYHFRIITDDDLNAFSTPGGYVYFTERIWNVLRPDERAGVLAHEIVHADRRHALDAMLKNQKRSTILGAILILVGANRSITDVVDIGNQIYTLKYSRGDERQADEVGTELLMSAKLNPAGLLLAMRKISRFQTESGGTPPTILSSHPDTDERLKYLGNYLTAHGIPIPPENIPASKVADKIGSVAKISGNTIQFGSSASLKPGDIVWLMGKGWDYNYETLSGKPIGRIVVTNASVQNKVIGALYPFSTTKPDDLKKAVDISALPTPPAATGIATMTCAQLEAGGVARILRDNGKALSAFDRMLAVAPVWDAKTAKVINDNVGYVVITDPNSTSGYVAASRPKYSYAPVSAGAILEKVNDPDSARWVGAVISIGKSSGKVELLPNRQLSSAKSYEVVAPAWNKEVTYEQRVIASAKLAPKDKNKIVMGLTKFLNGSNINSIQAGFDIYEVGKAKARQ